MTTRANKRKILDEIRKNDPCADNCFQVYIWCDMKCAFLRSVRLLPDVLSLVFDVLLDTKLEHLMSINGVLCSWKIKGLINIVNLWFTFNGLVFIKCFHVTEIDKCYKVYLLKTVLNNNLFIDILNTNTRYL